MRHTSLQDRFKYLRVRFKRNLVKTAGWAILLLHGALSGIAASSSQSLVPMRVVRGFAVVVPVVIDGNGPYEFLLDTGSTNTSVDRELGRTLAFEPNGEATVETVVGRIPVSIATAETLSVGPIVEANVEVLVRNLDGLKQLDPAIRGVLGQNALRHANYLLDYRRHRLQFDLDGELLSNITGERIQLGRLATSDNPNYSLSTVCAEIGGSHAACTTLALDSGSAVLVLFSALRENRQGFFGDTVLDVTGTRRESETRAVHIAVGGRKQMLDARVLGTRTMHDLGGLLPTSIFPSLYVSNRNNFVIFAPKLARRRVVSNDDIGLAHTWPPRSDRVPRRRFNLH